MAVRSILVIPAVLIIWSSALTIALIALLIGHIVQRMRQRRQAQQEGAAPMGEYYSGGNILLGRRVMPTEPVAIGVVSERIPSRTYQGGGPVHAMGTVADGHVLYNPEAEYGAGAEYVPRQQLQQQQQQQQQRRQHQGVGSGSSGGSMDSICFFVEGEERGKNTLDRGLA